MDTRASEAAEREGTAQRERSRRPRREFSAGDRLALTVGTALAAVVIAWGVALLARNAMNDRAVLEGQTPTELHRH